MVKARRRRRFHESVLKNIGDLCFLVPFWIRALVLGAFSALGLPPISLIACFWLGWVLFLFTARHERGIRRQMAGFFCFAMGYHLLGMHWVAGALIVADIPFAVWLVGPVACLFAAMLACFWAPLGIIAERFPDMTRRVVALSAGIVLVELVRGFLFTGLPWNGPGMIYASFLLTSQGFAWFGLYGMNLLAVLPAGLLAAALRKQGKARYGRMAFGIAVVLALMGGAYLRLMVLYPQIDPAGIQVSESGGDTNGDQLLISPPRVRLVQASIPQLEKWPFAFRERNLNRLLDTSLAYLPDDINWIIWPETALAFFPDQHPTLLREMLARLGPKKRLITGTPWWNREIEKPSNSMAIYTSNGELLTRYDKRHLVPFGEYFPFHDYLPFSQLVFGPSGGYEAGTGSALIQVEDLPVFAAAICYEIIFPNHTTQSGDGASLMINLTNDAWYEGTLGPEQHLVHARVQAIEQGLPLLRVANTGITTAIDAMGFEIGRIPFGVRGTLDVTIPKALDSTVARSWHMFPAIMLVLLCGVYLIFSDWARRKH